MLLTTLRSSRPPKPGSVLIEPGSVLIEPGSVKIQPGSVYYIARERVVI